MKNRIEINTKISKQQPQPHLQDCRRRKACNSIFHHRLLAWIVFPDKDHSNHQLNNLIIIIMNFKGISSIISQCKSKISIKTKIGIKV